jgi:hypothetical protein
VLGVAEASSLILTAAVTAAFRGGRWLVVLPAPCWSGPAVLKRPATASCAI